MRKVVFQHLNDYKVYLGAYCDSCGGHWRVEKVDAEVFDDKKRLDSTLSWLKGHTQLSVAEKASLGAEDA
jgi:hypothetical protein